MTRRDTTLIFEEDPLTSALRTKIREHIIELIQEELGAVLGAERYGRSKDRRGYRHGSEGQAIATSFGKTTFPMPRARLFNGDGSKREWHCRLIPRYQRRAKAIDDAIINLYLSGVNTRRIKRALRPLLKNTPLSKSAVSRLISRLKEHFETWQERPLDKEQCVYLYLDGFTVKIRLGGRSCRVSILAAVGVRDGGEKVLLGLWLKGSESTKAWGLVLENLISRGLPRPQLLIIDGNPGLRQAAQEAWPKIKVQRCLVHKTRNLLAHAPKHLHDELKVDFHRIVYAESLDKARKEWSRFILKWKKRCSGVVKSLEEGGEELLTFYRFPKAQWRSLRSTNIIERFYGEFRRRIKSQGVLPNENAVLVILYGLFVSGQIKLRRICGWHEMGKAIKRLDRAA